MPYPHGESCTCPPPTPDSGLLNYTVDCGHYRQLAALLAALTENPGVTLQAVPTETSACNGTLTCPCDRCRHERARRVQTGIRPTIQPWEPKRRRLAA